MAAKNVAFTPYGSTLTDSEYQRQTIGQQNRLAQDTSTNKWKTTIEDLGTNMRKQQLALRSANRRYDQVAAQGGSGDYGINDYTKSIQDIRNKIENAKRDIPTTSVSTPKTVFNIDKAQAAYDQSQKDIDFFLRGGLGAIDQWDRAKPGLETPHQYYDKLIKNQNNIKADLEAQKAAQQTFEKEQAAKASQFNSSQEPIEKQFIESILNAPLPEVKTSTGVDTRTPQEIAMQRDNTRNATLPAQERAADIPQQYLAKNKLPLQNLTASNLRQANQRVAGATLGGNTNKI